MLAHELRNPLAPIRNALQMLRARRRRAASAQCRCRDHRPPGRAPDPPGRRPARHLAHHPRQDPAADASRWTWPTWSRRRSRPAPPARRPAATSSTVELPDRAGAGARPTRPGCRRCWRTCSTTPPSTPTRAGGSGCGARRRAREVVIRGARHRHRHPARHAAPGLRPVHPGGRLARPHAQGPGHRPDAGEGPGGAPRRHASRPPATGRARAASSSCACRAGGRRRRGAEAASRARRRPSERAPAARRVLMVDDNIDAAETLAMMLEILGQDDAPGPRRPRGAHGRRAEYRPDVVFLDIGLPGISGLEACVRMRKDLGMTRHVPRRAVGLRHRGGPAQVDAGGLRRPPGEAAGSGRAAGHPRGRWRAARGRDGMMVQRNIDRPERARNGYETANYVVHRRLIGRRARVQHCMERKRGPSALFLFGGSTEGHGNHGQHHAARTARSGNSTTPSRSPRSPPRSAPAWPRPRSAARSTASSSTRRTASTATPKLAIVTDKDPEGLEIIRHSTAHLLAHAVKELFPDAQVTIGPVIENGFYYDFAYKRPFTPEDLAAIEKRMARDREEGHPGARARSGTRDEAVEFFKAIGEKYKAEIIAAIPAQRGHLALPPGRVHRPVPRPARALHGQAQGLQADEGRGRVLARRLEERDAAAHLRHGLGERRRTRTPTCTCSRRPRSATTASIGKQLDLFHMQEEAPGMVFWHPEGLGDLAGRSSSTCAGSTATTATRRCAARRSSTARCGRSPATGRTTRTTCSHGVGEARLTRSSR